MHFIAHRINTLEQLEKLPKNLGAEIDIRDYGNELVLQHDPFKTGERLDTFLSRYAHGTLILNIKSERIEHRVHELLIKHKIEDYFFLDSSFPMIKLLAEQGERKIALRFSEFEGMDTLRSMAGKVNWVWVDCFSKFPLTNAEYKEMQAMGYKLCFVSPELQGRPEDIEDYKIEMENKSIIFDAICTKTYCIDRWG